MTDSTFYRPEWTCGKYDKAHNAAILFNLIEGMSFYYEDITDEVIGCVLSVERNVPFTIEWLSKQSDVTVQSLVPFVEQLESYGLLTKSILNADEIGTYCHNLKETRRLQVVDNINAMHEMTVVGIASAERMYTLKSASNLNDNLNCSKELEHYAS